jgi:2,3-bisphosphoglycerate-independent phosphoglycerate mutase
LKYAIIIPDGCSDEPQESLGGKTPLQAARVPAMDAVAATGVVGRANNVPDHLPAGSDVANLSLFGYDPNEFFTGRAPLEAAAQGIDLAPDDWAIRCNLVTIEDQVMRDFTAGHISSDEAVALLKTAQQEIAGDRFEFIPGVSYRNLLIMRGEKQTPPFSSDTRTTPPHDLTDQSVADDYPRGPGSDLLSDMMSRSMAIFREHPVNVARIGAEKLPATNVWLWGLGRRPSLRAFADLHCVQGKMITAVDLLRGLAVLIGWERIEVPGTTGYLDTDYEAKGRHAVEALPDTDLICVHVEATDEASHEGRVDAKIEALQQIDRHVVAPVHEALQKYEDYRILVSPDHPTFLRTKTHAHGYVPFAMAGSDVEPDGAKIYDETQAADSEIAFDEGCRLMSYFIGK